MMCVYKLSKSFLSADTKYELDTCTSSIVIRIFHREREPYQARPLQLFARPGRGEGGGGLRGPDARNQG